jgi:hypothetical protein
METLAPSEFIWLPSMRALCVRSSSWLCGVNDFTRFAGIHCDVFTTKVVSTHDQRQAHRLHRPRLLSNAPARTSYHHFSCLPRTGLFPHRGACHWVPRWKDYAQDVERRQYSKRGDSSVGVRHAESPEGRAAKCHYCLEIRRVRMRSSPVACA